MATFNNVQELYDSIKDYLDRDDSSFTKKIPLWVSMAEDELDRRLRHPASETVFEYKVQKGVDVIPAPANLSELRTIRNKNTNLVLTKRYPETLYMEPKPCKEPTSFMSRANYYVLNMPVVEDTTFEYVFYIIPDRLGDQHGSSLYLEVLGDFLLFVALEHGFTYGAADAEAAYFRGLAERSLANIQQQINDESIAGSTIFNFGDMSQLERYY